MITTGLGILIGFIAIALAIIIAAILLSGAIKAPKQIVMSHQWNIRYGAESPQNKLPAALLWMVNRISAYFEKLSK